MTNPLFEDAPVVVFDLDGVLTSHDTMTVLCRRQLLRRPTRLPRAARLLLRRHSCRAAPERQRIDAALVALALRGVDAARYRCLVEKTALQFQRRGWRRQELLDQLHAVPDGRRVVVATATEEILARAVLRSAGIERDVELFASRLEWFTQGGGFHLHNVGVMKLQSLEQARVPLGVAVFFTDSTDDLPVAHAVRHTVYVGENADAFQQFPRASWWSS